MENLIPTRNRKNDKVEITCYGKKRVMRRQEALDFFLQGMMECDGAEQERYTSIYCQLKAGFRVISDEDPVYGII